MVSINPCVSLQNVFCEMVVVKLFHSQIRLLLITVENLGALLPYSVTLAHISMLKRPGQEAGDTMFKVSRTLVDHRTLPVHFLFKKNKKTIITTYCCGLLIQSLRYLWQESQAVNQFTLWTSIAWITKTQRQILGFHLKFRKAKSANPLRALTSLKSSYWKKKS